MLYTVWTTSACNLRCNYCYEGLNKEKLNLEKALADKIINFIEKDFDDEELIVNFHGGEPFLNFSIMKYIVYRLKDIYKGKCELNFTVTTNCTVVNEEIKNFIIAENIGLTVSIDGNQKTHDRMRKFANGVGSHHSVMQNVRYLISNLSNVRVRMTCCPETIVNLSQDIKYLLEQGFRIIVPILDSFDKRWTEEHFMILKEEIINIKNFIKDYADANVGICEPLTYCGNECTGGIISRHIYYDGTIYPCLVTCGKEEYKIGDIFKGINVEKRDELLRYSLTENPKCTGCDLQVFCTGQRCKIINKLVTGKFNNPISVDCNLTNLIYELNGVDVTSIL